MKRDKIAALAYDLIDEDCDELMALDLVSEMVEE